MLHIPSTMVKFALVGVVNTLVGTAVMLLLYNVFGCSYWFSSAANYFIGSIISYCLNRWYTFRYHGSTWRSVLRFAINIIVCYLIAYSVAQPLAKWVLSGLSVAVQENVAMLTGTVLFIVINYLGQRFFAFRESKHE